MERSQGSKRNWLWTTVAVLAGCLLVYLAAPVLVGPPVPNRVVIATGSSTGVYFEIANRYKEVLARDGIELEIRPTAGSIENLHLLHENGSDVSLAIVQGGTSTPQEEEDLSSLASLYLEPVWIFYRSDVGPLKQIGDLRDRRVGIGPAGSGTRAIALEWLHENGLIVAADPDSEPKAVADSKIQLEPITGQEAVDKLEQKQLDAAFFVIGPTAPVIAKLTRLPGVELFNMSRTKAFETKYRYLKSVTCTEGMLDLAENLPPQDVTLLAATASLVARKDIHPALIPLLLQAAIEVHDDGGFFEAPGQFPAANGVDLAINPAARRFHKNGPSFLYRYLPFRYAGWLDRMKLLLAPLAILLLPLLKAFPPIYRWRIRSKIYRWYNVLREIDQKLQDGELNDYTADIRRLELLETELAEVSVPLSYMEEFYNLRLHVNYVVNLLTEKQKASSE